MPEKNDESFKRKLDKIIKRLDMILVVLLAKSGLKLNEIAEILGISERTIRRMLPFRKIKQKRKEE